MIKTEKKDILLILSFLYILFMIITLAVRRNNIGNNDMNCYFFVIMTVFANTVIISEIRNSLNIKDIVILATIFTAMVFFAFNYINNKVFLPILILLCIVYFVYLLLKKQHILYAIEPADEFKNLHIYMSIFHLMIICSLLFFAFDSINVYSLLLYIVTLVFVAFSRKRIYNNFISKNDFYIGTFFEIIAGICMICVVPFISIDKITSFQIERTLSDYGRTIIICIVVSLLEAPFNPICKIEKSLKITG